MQPSNQPSRPNDEKSRIDGRALSKLSVPWCVLDWAKFKPPELRARGRRNALANVTENRALTYQMVQSSNTQLPSDGTSTNCEWADRACLEWWTGPDWKCRKNHYKRGAGFHTHAMTLAMNFSCQFPKTSCTLLELKRSWPALSPNRFPASFFWAFLLLAKETSGERSGLRHLDLESDRWSIHLSALPPGPAVSLPRTFFSFLTLETSRKWPLTSLASKWAPRWTVVPRAFPFHF